MKINVTDLAMLRQPLDSAVVVASTPEQIEACRAYMRNALPVDAPEYNEIVSGTGERVHIGIKQVVLTALDSGALERFSTMPNGTMWFDLA